MFKVILLLVAVGLVVAYFKSDVAKAKIQSVGATLLSLVVKAKNFVVSKFKKS